MFRFIALPESTKTTKVKGGTTNGTRGNKVPLPEALPPAPGNCNNIAHDKTKVPIIRNANRFDSRYPVSKQDIISFIDDTPMGLSMVETF